MKKNNYIYIPAKLYDSAFRKLSPGAMKMYFILLVLEHRMCGNDNKTFIVTDKEMSAEVNAGVKSISRYRKELIACNLIKYTRVRKEFPGYTTGASYSCYEITREVN